MGVRNLRGLYKWGGGQKFAKNGFLRYLLETSAFYEYTAMTSFSKRRHWN